MQYRALGDSNPRTTIIMESTAEPFRGEHLEA